MERTITITVKGNEYTTKFPTVGQLIDIETEKSILARGQYGSMVQGGMTTAYNALSCIDVVAYFKVLFPKIFEDLKVKEMEDIDAIDFSELVKVYKDQFHPWIEEWLKEFKSAMSV